MALNDNPILRAAYRASPRLRPLMRDFYGLLIGRQPPHFSGWLMTTDHEHGWAGNTRFAETIRHLRSFAYTRMQTTADLEALRWRYWVVAYAAQHAVAHTEAPEKVFVECGVADGTTAYCALRHGMPTKMHLYDAWGGETASVELSEYYSGLAMERTKANLVAFDDRIEWHRGRMPASFTGPVPAIVYLSIDLNSAEATVDVLARFWPALAVGGVVLFDDYGWRAYSETKVAVDQFFLERPGTLLTLPTGQALYFR